MRIRIRQAPSIKPRKSWLAVAAAFLIVALQTLFYFFPTFRVVVDTCKGGW